MATRANQVQLVSACRDPGSDLRREWLEHRIGGKHIITGTTGAHYANVVDLVLTDYEWDPLGLDIEDDTDGDGKPDDVLVI